MIEFTRNDAKKVFQTMTDALDAKGWKYQAIPEELLILSIATGDDFPIKYSLRIDPDRAGVHFVSTTIATFDKDHRDVGAFAACIANHGLLFGHFDYDLASGDLHYVMFDSLFDSAVGESFFWDMMHTGIEIADRYNDRFIMLANNMIDLVKFSEME